MSGLLVYNAIVFIIGILLDEKRNQNAGIDLRRILDTYISEHFTGAMAHKHLMNCLKQYLDRIDDKSQISKIIATFKVRNFLGYVCDQNRPWNTHLNLLSSLAFFTLHKEV